MYNAQYFIDRYKPIPDRLWVKGHYVQRLKFLGTTLIEKHCALGHLGDIGSSKSRTAESQAIMDLFRIHLHKSVPTVNDGLCLEYQQKTPKERVLAALEEIKELEQEAIQTDSAVQEVNNLLTKQAFVTEQYL